VKFDPPCNSDDQGSLSRTELGRQLHIQSKEAAPAIDDRAGEGDHHQRAQGAGPRVPASFNDIADSSELVTLESMPMDVVVDHAANTVSFNAALRYGELVETLSAEGVALHNLASLPHA
jgi:hypothetical protein